MKVAGAAVCKVVPNGIVVAELRLAADTPAVRPTVVPTTTAPPVVAFMFGTRPISWLLLLTAIPIQPPGADSTLATMGDAPDVTVATHTGTTKTMTFTVVETRARPCIVIITSSDTAKLNDTSTSVGLAAIAAVDSPAIPGVTVKIPFPVVGMVALQAVESPVMVEDWIVNIVVMPAVSTQVILSVVELAQDSVMELRKLPGVNRIVDVLDEEGVPVPVPLAKYCTFPTRGTSPMQNPVETLSKYPMKPHPFDDKPPPIFFFGFQHAF